ncbi:Tll0287-like domain-containing protein [Aequorivita marina]|uniref:Tll0287-like domain-containing protein n=1 Tax=Aequorivita marina TaxID=3073654 RepID=UPI00287414EC|nr:DUF3365 domain-containing protein [Aequorivita sp. S2608]MDS1299325.1 DUF3365 domain-containing protein [Aequorivita sp. S2608]
MRIFFTLVSGLLIMSCNTNTRKTYTAMAESTANIKMEAHQEHPGKNLMVNNCYMCHNPKTAQEDLIAPPMIAVKKHYIQEETTKEGFVNAMVAWSKSPSKSLSKMPGAVKKFGLMPYQFYPENTIRQIADYMYEYNIEEPTWFEAHYSKMHGKHAENKGNMKNRKAEKSEANGAADTKPAQTRGMEIAKATQAALGKNLMGQVKKNGVIAALEFCNIEAMPITDSMATAHKAQIKRVTDKARNPENQANTTQLQYIEDFKKQVAAGGEVQPIVIEKEEVTEFYAPIITNAMCLKCHGTPEKELESLTLNKINELYPHDAATGYSVNEVRGMWSIQFSQ